MVEVIVDPAVVAAVAATAVVAIGQVAETVAVKGARITVDEAMEKEEEEEVKLTRMATIGMRLKREESRTRFPTALSRCSDFRPEATETEITTDGADLWPTPLKQVDIMICS